MSNKILLLALCFTCIVKTTIGQKITELHFSKNGKLTGLSSGILNNKLDIIVDGDFKSDQLLFSNIKNRILYTDSLVRGAVTGRELLLRDSLWIIRSQIRSIINEEKELSTNCIEKIKELIIEAAVDCPEISDLSFRNIGMYLDSLFFADIITDIITTRNAEIKRLRAEMESADTVTQKRLAREINRLEISFYSTEINSYCFSEICKCEYLVNSISNLLTIKKELFTIQQKKALFKDLLCNENNFSGNITALINPDNEPGKNNSPAIRNSIIPSSLQIYPAYTLNGGVLKNNAAKNMFTGSYTLNDNKNTIVLQKELSFQKQLINWHNQNSGILKKEVIDYYDTLIMKEKKEIEAMYKEVIDCKRSETRGSSALTLYRRLNRFEKAWCPTSEIAIWLKNWAWYSGGEFLLNYLPVSSLESKEKQLRDKYQSEPADLLDTAAVGQQLRKINELKNCLKCGILSLDTLAALQKKEKELIEKQKENLRWKKELEKYRKEYQSFITADLKVHELRLPECCGKNWIQFHDVENDYLLCQRKKPVLMDELPVYFGFYNAKSVEDKDLKITEVKEEFKDKGFFVQEVSAALNEMAGVINPLLPAADEINKFLGKISGTHPGKSSGQGEFNAQGILDSLNKSLGDFIKIVDILSEKMPQVTAPENLKNPRELAGFPEYNWFTYLNSSDFENLLLQAIDQKYWRFQLLEDMILKNRKNPSPEKIEAATNKENMFITYTRKATSWAAPYTNKYTLSYKEKEVSQNRYSVGQQRSVTIGTGIFVNSNTARQVNVDSTGSRIAITNTDNRAKFVIGFKVFPWKSFMADDGIIPRYPLKRFSLFSGFEITKPKDNLYFGIGYDLFPGLNINAGYHVYKQNVYKVVNNQLTAASSNYRGSGIYYGLTLDPEVAAGIIKVFFK